MSIRRGQLGMVAAVAALVVIVSTFQGMAAEDDIRLHPKGQRLVSGLQGPYANLPDGSVLAVDSREALISGDEGKTWKSYPLFGDPEKFLARPERALIRTRQGTLVMGFLNEKEITRGKWLVNDREGELWITTMQGGLRMRISTADIPDEAWPKAVKVVALGSSTTALRGSVGRVYCDWLDTMLRDRGLPVEIVNSGIGGSTTEHSRARFQKDVLDHDPELVIIMLGGNDAAIDVWKSPPAATPRVAKQRYAENLRNFVETLRARTAKVILVAPPPFRWTAKLKQLYGKPPYDVNDPWGFSAKLAEYCDVVRAVAREEDVPLVDVFEAFQEYDRPDGQSVDDLFVDGMHPNDKGHAIIAELLVPVIEKACSTSEASASR